VVVGPSALLTVRAIEGDDLVWLADGGVVGERVECAVQVRAHGEPVRAVATLLGPADAHRAIAVQVELFDGLRGLAPGQSLVLYDGTRVLGQATVTSGVRGRMAS
jgi:tRNA-specific 2-thiouridylase